MTGAQGPRQQNDDEALGRALSHRTPALRSIQTDPIFAQFVRAMRDMYPAWPLNAMGAHSEHDYQVVVSALSTKQVRAGLAVCMHSRARRAPAPFEFFQIARAVATRRTPEATERVSNLIADLCAQLKKARQ